MEKTTPSHLIIKLLMDSDKENILKAAKATRIEKHTHISYTQRNRKEDESGFLTGNNTNENIVKNHLY